MVRWEYKLVCGQFDDRMHMRELTEELLCDLGMTGWELVWMNEQGTEAVFKRPIQET